MWQHAALVPCFTAWRDCGAADKQRKVTLARFAAKMKNRLEFSTFSAWTTAVAAWRYERVVVTRFAAKMKNRLVLVVFMGWGEASAAWKHERVVITRFAAKMKNRYAHSLFISWVEYASGQQEARQLLIRILNRMVHAYSGRGFHHWANQLRAEDEAKLQDTVEAQEREKVLADKLLKRENAVAAIAKLQGDVVTKIFVSWRTHVQREIRNRAVCAAFAAKLQSRHAAAALASWLEFVEWREDARRLLSRVLGGRQRALLNDAWRRWKGDSMLETRAALEAELEAQRAELAELRMALANQRTVHAADARKSSENFIKRWMNDAKASAFASWQSWRVERAATIERIGKLLLHAELRFAKVAFANWKEEITTGLQRQVTLARFGAKLKCRQAFVCFSAWRADASASKHERVVLARCALKIRRRLETSILQSWVEYVSMRQEARALLTRILNRMIHAYSGRGFHHWVNQLRAEDEAKLQDTVETQEREKLLADKLLKRENAIAAIAKLQGDAVTRVFVSWRTCVQRENRNRTVCAAFAAKLQSRHAAAALASWLEFVAWREEARKLLARVLGGREHAAQRSSFYEWARHAGEAARQSKQATVVNLEISLSELRARVDTLSVENSQLKSTLSTLRSKSQNTAQHQTQKSVCRLSLLRQLPTMPALPAHKKLTRNAVYC